MLSLLLAAALATQERAAPVEGPPPPPEVSYHAERMKEKSAKEDGPKSADWKFHDQSTLTFMRIDQNHDDVVTMRELRSHFARGVSRMKISQNDKFWKVKSSVAQYLRMFDVDGSGDVTFAEVVEGGNMKDRRLEKRTGSFS